MSSYQLRYNHKSEFFRKNGQYRGEVRCKQIPVLEHGFDPAKEDRKNRNEVTQEIIRLVNNGVELEEACESLVEKYKDKFKYFPEGSLSKIFANWYNGYIRPKKEFEKYVR